MKILLDTNIIIHREAGVIKNQDIGLLFNWIDKLKHDKYIHPLTVEELNRNIDPKSVNSMNIKIQSYNLIKNIAPLTDKIIEVSAKIDTLDNDINDTKILNEVFAERVDILISEDKKIHKKAELLGIKNKVFKIQQFLEKVTAENPNLVDYKVLAVKKVDFAQVDINDVFFDSFREDYQEFNKWFNKKADEICYVCYHENILSAFLFIKVEGEDENYSEITPNFTKKKRLKIGTLKVTSNGFKIGERFLKIIFDNALQYRVEEIYVTIFDKRPEQEQLIDLLEVWGFVYHGIKTTKNGNEKVYVRTFGKDLPVNIENPKLTFPFFSRESNAFIISIEAQYHTELFPDSINTKEDVGKYIDNEPHRNRIGKVYISHAPQTERNLKPGDVIIIYRMGEPNTPKRYTSTITTICIIESVYDDITTFQEFYEICNRRTFFSREVLKSSWWEKKHYKPFVVNLLSAHSFPTPKPTLNDLNTLGINIGPGFIKLTKEQLVTLINFGFKDK